MTLTRLFTHSGRGRTTRAAVLLLVVGATGLVSGCSKTVREGQSPAYLVLRSLEGSSGGSDSAEFSTVLRSDVATNNSIFEDNGRVTLTVAMRDVSVTGPTSNNLVTLNRYRVQYRRTDGRNTPGEDVPYPVEGGIGVTVGEQLTEAVFSIVRAQAKLEKPLVTLRGLNGALIISTIADVTFFGKDQTGRDVTVSGSISVNFADWADKDN
jgi:hypothetical protein